MLKEFAEAAKALTKNPLGVIGLFIVMVYGFACLVTGLSGQALDCGERRILIWFLALFPVLILCAFFRLVTNHHKKLYAPSDYKDEKLFLEPMSQEQKEHKLEMEVTRNAGEEEAKSTDAGKEAHPAQATPLTTRASIRASYVDAERLAFIAIEKELGKPVQKYIEVSSHGKKEQFDGVLITDKEAHLIEIKYFTQPRFKREFIEAIIHRASSFVWGKTMAEGSEYEAALWIVLVVNFDKDLIPEFKKKIDEAASCNLFRVEVRLYTLDDLRKQFDAQGGS